MSPRPYTGDLPFTSPTELFAASGEQRHVYLDVGKGALDHPVHPKRRLPQAISSYVAFRQCRCSTQGLRLLSLAKNITGGLIYACLMHFSRILAVIASDCLALSDDGKGVHPSVGRFTSDFPVYLINWS